MRKLALPLLFVAAPLAAQAEELVIAALGDSLTAGYGLPQEDGLVPQLQGWLDAEGAEVRLINAGVSGDTSAGGLSRIGWTLTEEVDALIVALGGNDYLRGLPPEALKDNLGGILEAAGEAGVEVLLVGISATANYGADYRDAFNAVYPDLAEQYGALVYPNIFAALQDGRGLDEARRAYMQADGIHPNAEGVGLIVEAIGPSVLDLAEAARGDDTEAAVR
ncbi:arylesterase [Limimaricola pyoseonensis]|uniref:Acyl-CoA thioesterase-1 n=1 Tax=Limimaricola pyoseonensis TaxID=521013 RepID=A0A1G7G4Y2_9RHOB|nr:arylesterase [Limimaricola pyoseonensis]SDE83173.1 acyl-CoA thioesterase-1 [Limimaricola pyoseonensis]